MQAGPPGRGGGSRTVWVVSSLKLLPQKKTHWLIPPHSRNLHVQTSPKHVGRRSAEHWHIEPLHASAVRYARTLILHAKKRTLITSCWHGTKCGGSIFDSPSRQSDFRRSHVRHEVHQRVSALAPSYASAINGKRRLRANEEEEPNPVPSAGSLARRPGAHYTS